MTEADKLDCEIDLVKYISCRKNEIDLLKSDSFLSKETNQKSLFQLLPRHMRRRTMGYLRKRLPRRIRHMATIKAPNKVSKRPSRKFRRKPANLLKEYERRKHAKDYKMWLETHIWHAKRFKMAESLYEYRLPVNFHCKCKRAVFKCLKDFCCIHDESYYVCYQLEGKQSDLLAGLNRLCSQETGLTFGASMYLDGQYEGHLAAYEADKYPLKCIGPVRFLWKVRNCEVVCDERRALWIWCHPSTYKSIAAQFQYVFNLSAKSSQTTEEKMDIDINDQITRTTTIESDVFSSNDEQDIRLLCLKDKLVRFKLLGPMSTSILANVLQTVPSSGKRINLQHDLWNRINQSSESISELMPAIGLLVKDPRLVLPKKKLFTKTYQQTQKSTKTELDAELKNSIRTNILSSSSIWSREAIAELNQSKKTTHEINKLRSKFLIPGTEIEMQDQSKVPILVIQNTIKNKMFSIQNGSLHSGWDIIVPNTWGMDFWLPLVHMGARAIAQKELNYLLFESGNLQFPNEWIDTDSSRIENEANRDLLFKKHLARPPSKRINFLDRACLSPFSNQWSAVQKLHSTSTTADQCVSVSPFGGSFFILKNRKINRKLEQLFFTRQTRLDAIDTSFTEAEMSMINNSYVGVRLTSYGKGAIEQFSMILMGNVNSDKNTIVKDDLRNMSIRKIISDSKIQHQNLVKEAEPASKTEVTKPTLNKLLRSKYNKHKLLVDDRAFLEHEFNMLDSEQYRMPIGFVQNSGFTLTNGKCSANAFVLAKSILNMIKLKSKSYDPTLVSYKSPSSECLRQAKVVHFYI